MSEEIPEGAYGPLQKIADNGVKGISAAPQIARRALEGE